jgi:hypothetical protein
MFSPRRRTRATQMNSMRYIMQIEVRVLRYFIKNFNNIFFINKLDIFIYISFKILYEKIFLIKTKIFYRKNF